MGHRNDEELSLNMKKENVRKDLKLNFSINLLPSCFQYFFSIENTRHYYNELYKSDRKGKDRYKDQIGIMRYTNCMLLYGPKNNLMA